MARYTAIADVGNALVTLLRAHLVPDIILNPDHIALCSPGERGNAVLGIYLYDICEDEALRTSEMLHLDARTQRYPSTFLNLSYMITAYSTGDIKFKSAEEQRILGRVIQVLRDFSVMDASTLQTIHATRGDSIRFIMQDMPIEEKMRIWNAPNTPYKLSLAYKAMPVEIESMRTKTITRIVETDFQVYE